MTTLAPAGTRSSSTARPDVCGCQEGRRLELSRRGMLAAMGGTALVTATLGDAQLAFGATAGTAPNVLVTVILGGGHDGLSAVVPLGDPDYAPNRPGIAIPASLARQVDSMFGLHPALAPLFPLWDAGTFGAVQAVGQVSPTRSHFEAMEELERAAPSSSLRTGWLNRTLGLLPDSGTLEAVALGDSELPGHLRGSNPTMAARLLRDITLPVDLNVTPLPLWQQAIAQLHTGARPEVSTPMKSALDVVAAAGAVPESTGSGYPNNTWGRALADIARLVKADVGLQVASVPYGGWDYHENFGPPDGGGSTFAGRLSTLAQGLAALANDLGPDFARVTIVTLTEFGRRVEENGSGGLDHGHGFAVLLLGGGVNGGQVHGRWPGLAAANLDRDQDLAVTTDYRSIISEILVGRMGVSSTTPVFPGFSASPVGAVGSA